MQTPSILRRLVHDPEQAHAPEGFYPPVGGPAFAPVPIDAGYQSSHRLSGAQWATLIPPAGARPHNHGTHEKAADSIAGYTAAPQLFVQPLSAMSPPPLTTAGPALPGRNVVAPQE